MIDDITVFEYLREEKANELKELREGQEDTKNQFDMNLNKRIEIEFNRNIVDEIKNKKIKETTKHELLLVYFDELVWNYRLRIVRHEPDRIHSILKYLSKEKEITKEQIEEIKEKIDEKEEKIQQIYEDIGMVQEKTIVLEEIIDQKEEKIQKLSSNNEIVQENILQLYDEFNEMKRINEEKNIILEEKIEILIKNKESYEKGIKYFIVIIILYILTNFSNKYLERIQYNNFIE